jgi:membrane-associated protease RseP (regulator of RpoE activity)
VAIGPIHDPTAEELVRFTRRNAETPLTLSIERDGRTFPVTLTPVMATVAGQQVPRIGVDLSGRLPVGVVGSITGAAGEVGDGLVRTVQGVGRIFGPSGIGRVYQLVTTDAPRQQDDPQSVVGVGRVAGAIASEGHFGDMLYLFAIVNIFVGFLNLLPLPPFDGGHLAVLAIEKLRGGRPVDMRKVMPISAVVAAFFILFTAAVVWVDIVKPPV